MQFGNGPTFEQVHDIIYAHRGHSYITYAAKGVRGVKLHAYAQCRIKDVCGPRLIHERAPPPWVRQSLETYFRGKGVKHIYSNIESFGLPKALVF